MFSHRSHFICSPFVIKFFDNTHFFKYLKLITF
nr:MAG TPA: hypothetical protein [Caudoviricetes sp.]DAW32095.1 MAG TPA: hypothetical protein [Caudoviricetes sp.]